MSAITAENSILTSRIRAFARRGSLPHALILSGSGDRVAAARYASAAMLCTAEQDKPCLQCNQCRKTLQNIHPDVLAVEDNDHKHLLVDDVREFRRSVYIRPNEGVRKVAIFPRAEQLTDQEQNLLLKIVEEGPAYSAFIFCVENSASLLPTVRSRCVELKLQQDAPTAEPDMALLQAFAAAKAGKIAAHLANLESRKTTREQLQLLLQATWRTCAEALLVQSGKSAPDPALAEGAALLAGSLDRKQLAALTDLLYRYAQECQYNVGPGHVLGALAAEWENIV